MRLYKGYCISQKVKYILFPDVSATQRLMPPSAVFVTLFSFENIVMVHLCLGLMVTLETFWILDIAYVV